MFSGLNEFLYHNRWYILKSYHKTESTVHLLVSIILLSTLGKVSAGTINGVNTHIYRAGFRQESTA